MGTTPLLMVAAATAIMMMLTARRHRARHARVHRPDWLPSPGRATFEDVRRLAVSGEHHAASLLYRELTGCGQAEARKVVRRMDR